MSSTSFNVGDSLTWSLLTEIMSFDIGYLVSISFLLYYQETAEASAFRESFYKSDADHSVVKNSLVHSVSVLLS